MTWARIDDEIFFNPKVFVLSPEAKLLYMAGIVFSSKFLTDGNIASGDAIKLARMTGLDVESKLITELVSSGLWHETDNGWEIHDYLEYNPSREHVEEVRRKRREAGKMGGRPPKNQIGKQLVNQGGGSSNRESSTLSEESATTTRNPFGYQNANQNAFTGDEHAAEAWRVWLAAGGHSTNIMADMVSAEVDDWKQDGHPEYVAQAISEAAKAGKVSWSYVEGILNRCRREGTSPTGGKTNGKHDPAKSDVRAAWEEVTAWAATESPLALAAEKIMAGYAEGTADA